MSTAIFLAGCALAFLAWCMAGAYRDQRRHTKALLDGHREEIRLARERTRKAEEAYQRWLAANPPPP